jgi:hypothetical protein
VKGKIPRRKIPQHRGRRKRKRNSMITPCFAPVGGRYGLIVLNGVKGSGPYRSDLNSVERKDA